MEELRRIKIILRIDENDTSQDELIQVLYDITKEQIYAETNRCDIDSDSKLTTLILNSAVIRYGRLGAEGKSSETIGPLSTQYYGGTEDLPESIKRQIKSCRKLGRVKR